MRELGKHLKQCFFLFRSESHKCSLIFPCGSWILIFAAHYRVEGYIFSFAAPQLHGRVVDFGVTENFCVTCACWGGDVIDLMLSCADAFCGWNCRFS